MNKPPLFPEDVKKDQLYILATDVGSHVNMQTWRWLAGVKKWQVAVGKARYTYSAQEMANACWEIIEPTTELVYWVKDFYGRVFTSPPD